MPNHDLGRGLAPLASLAVLTLGHTLVAQSPSLLCVADRQADPDGLGGDTGAVFLYEDGVLVDAITSLDFVDPIGVEYDEAGNIYILDASADPLQEGLSTGAIFRHNSAGQVELYAVSATTAALSDFVRAPDGTLYVTGAVIVEPGPDLVAAVFEVDASGLISVFSSGPELSEPTGIAIAPNGDLIVSDRSAEVAPETVGAVFRIDSTGAISVVASSTQFADLQGVAVSADGLTYHVIDEAADPNSVGSSGAIFNVTPSGAVSVWASDPRFSKLNKIISLSGGGALVLDTDAMIGGPTGSPGAVFEVSESAQVTVSLADGVSWSEVRGVSFWVASAAGVPGDLDGDGDVDLTDFAAFAQCFGGSNQPPAGSCPGVDADLDADGDVDLSDFAIMAQNFGN